MEIPLDCLKSSFKMSPTSCGQRKGHFCTLMTFNSSKYTKYAFHSKIDSGLPQPQPGSFYMELEVHMKQVSKGKCQVYF